MNRRNFLLASGGLTAAVASGFAKQAFARGLSTEAASPGTMINSFGSELYAKLREKPGNVFLSPFSISAALGMTAVGAGGDTLSQMQKVLHLPENGIEADRQYASLVSLFSKPNTNFKLTTANAIWAQNGHPWKESFKIRVAQYGAGLREVDFAKEPDACRGKINAWVEKQTHEKIKELFAAGTIDNMTRMVLANAVYFKGNWASAFDQKLTKPAPFLLANGQKSEAQLMSIKGSYNLYERDGLQVLSLPYKGNDLSMLVALPAKPDGLADLEAKLSAEEIQSWTKNAVSAGNVSVFLPRFKSETSYELNDPLKQLGMHDAFDAKKCDFSNMQSGKDELFISLVVHKAYVDVNEEGTEAAAATGVKMALRSAPVPRKPNVFRADHPFLYAIKHNPTGTILFLGRVEKI